MEHIIWQTRAKRTTTTTKKKEINQEYDQQATNQGVWKAGKSAVRNAWNSRSSNYSLKGDN